MASAFTERLNTILCRLEVCAIRQGEDDGRRLKDEMAEVLKLLDEAGVSIEHCDRWLTLNDRLDYLERTVDANEG